MESASVSPETRERGRVIVSTCAVPTLGVLDRAVPKAPETLAGTWSVPTWVLLRVKITPVPVHPEARTTPVDTPSS